MFSYFHNLILNNLLSFYNGIILSIFRISNQTLNGILYFTWPDDSVTPKMHLLESHVHQFIEKRRLGIGVYGEQGGESLHAEFNNLNRLFWHMKGCRWLESTIKEHFIRNHPNTKDMKPNAKSKNEFIDIFYKIFSVKNSYCTKT